MRRREFLRIMPLAGGVMRAEAANDQPHLRFGVIADCQYADQEVDPKLNRHYRLSPQKLSEAVEHLNLSSLDFVVNVGDTIDRRFQSFEKVLPIFRALRMQCYHVLGNHDFDVAEDVKAIVARRLGIEGSTYFAWNRKGWRFVVLDGNEVSLFAHPRASPAYLESEKYYQSIGGKAPTYNGAVGAGQLRWLRGQLEASRLHHERVIVFCHYPVFPENHHNLWNASELLKLISPFNDVVAAWMNGHNHGGNYGVKDGIHFVNFKGMVDTTENCWAEVAVFADRLEITGYAREPSRDLETKSAGGG
ncbi:MAG: metallophosphoesterase [Verrucomicrobiales bacterium]